MAEKAVSTLPSPGSEDLRIAAGHFEYAHRATSAGNYDIAINMLRTCCRLVPANLAYRQALRKVAKTKYRNNLRGSVLAPLTSWRSKLRLWQARREENHLKVLEYGEAVLAKNPWDRDTILCMADSASSLQLIVIAVWLLQDSRDKNPNDVRLNRALARLLEREGKFAQAMALWELVRKVLPTDREATDKARQLAVSETIARGNYGEAVANEAGLPPGKLKSPSSDSIPTSPSKSRPVQEAEVLRTRIAADPTVPENYLHLAALEKRYGKISEAKAILEEGFAATRQNPALAQALAELEVELLRRLLTQTDEQLNAAPEDDKLQKNRKKILHKINTLELTLYRQKVHLNPADANLRFELGSRLYQAGQIDEAISELQAARSEPRLYWKAVLYLGHCFASREKWPLAQRNFEEALKKMPENEKEHRKDVLFLLARGYAESGELPRAVELGLDLADMDYGYREIGALLEQWQLQLKQPRGSTRAVKPKSE